VPIHVRRLAAVASEVAHISFDGALDVASAAIARLALADLLTAHPGCVIHVDLSELKFLDSTALGMFLSVRKQAIAAGGDLRLLNLQDSVMQVLALTGVDTILCDTDKPTMAELIRRAT
jgi:anti-anti-sigma factor